MEDLRRLASTDLNLLTVYRAIDEYRHVTKAAKAINLSQPALSHALKRLRELFDDPLFVKTVQGMMPTPRANRLRGPVRDVLRKIEESVLVSESFTPSTLERTFRIMTTDFLEALVIPPLLGELTEAAPHVKIGTTSLGFSLPKEVLERGDCDIAIAGFFPTLPEGFYKQKLFSDKFSCAVRKQHPRLKKKEKLSLSDYCKEKHTLIAPNGELSSKLDSDLKKLGVQRTVVSGLSTFMVSGWVAHQTDLMLTAPSLMIGNLAKYFDLRVFPLPFATAEIDIQQVWHERNNDDPAHRWLRAKIAKIFNTSPRRP